MFCRKDNCGGGLGVVVEVVVVDVDVLVLVLVVVILLVVEEKAVSIFDLIFSRFFFLLVLFFGRFLVVTSTTSLET